MRLNLDALLCLVLTPIDKESKKVEVSNYRSVDLQNYFTQLSMIVSMVK